jgi:hypothetical protein
MGFAHQRLKLVRFAMRQSRDGDRDERSRILGSRVIHSNVFSRRPVSRDAEAHRASDARPLLEHGKTRVERDGSPRSGDDGAANARLIVDGQETTVP